MGTTIEALGDAPTVKGKTAGRSFRQCFTPTVLVTVDPNAPAIAARRIMARLMDINRGSGAGVYAFIDPDLQVFVVSEERSVAQEWVKRHFDWLVAFYTLKPARGPQIPYLSASVEGIVEDIVDHLADLKRVKA